VDRIGADRAGLAEAQAGPSAGPEGRENL